MTKLIRTSCLALGLATISLLSASCSSSQPKTSQSKGEPHFIVEKKIHSFGKINAGEQLVAYFQIQNDGKTPLILERFDTGCGCLEAELPKKPIVPGGKEYISVIFDSTGEFGNIYKVMKVYTNDPRKTFNLTVTGYISNNL